ncbi:MAG TPA: DUF2339 domain-containing protein, partial [Rhodoblastus sp.]|nr:DUF2339 domain-containing protein [Rhodoblastus sp.]
MEFFAGLLSLLGAFAFFLVLDARGHMKRLETALRALEAEVRELRARREDAAAAPEAVWRSAPEAAPAFEPAPSEAPAPEPPPKKRRASLEQTIGTRWAVYIGGLALALGGLLLVRYAIEQGFFGPAARVLLGLAFSFALIGAGEILRRRERAGGEATPTPAVLTAAGVTSGFGAIYAAHALYGFIGPTLAFLALGGFALGAMAAALWHGPAIAGLGLAGALAAPLLVESAQPSPWPLLVYLGVVAAASHGLALLRRWSWLSLAGALGAAIWGLGFTLGRLPAFPQAAEIHFVLQLALACLAFSLAARPPLRPLLAHAGPLGLALVATFALAVCANRGAFDLLWSLSAFAIIGLLALTGAARPALASG